MPLASLLIGLVLAGLALSRGSTFEAFIAVAVFTSWAVVLLLARSQEDATILLRIAFVGGTAYLVAVMWLRRRV